MKLWKRTLSLLLALVMVLGFVPLQLFATEANATASNVNSAGFYRVFHLDAGRKYYNLASLKRFVDMAAKNGYNQFNLYLSDNQGLRIKLDDMTVATQDGTYDLTDCVGEGITEDYFKPSNTDGTDSKGYLTQDEMQYFVTYAKSKGLAVCATINTPAHMGAILQDLKRDGSAINLKADTYGSGLAAIKLDDDVSIRFITALTKKFVDAFAAMGCEYYCIGGDEYMSGYTAGTGYDNFVAYVNEVGAYIQSKGMTPRMFNDAFRDNTPYTGISKDYELYYWSDSPGRQARTAPQTLLDAGYNLINTPEAMYYVLRDTVTGWWLVNPTVQDVEAWNPNLISNSSNCWNNHREYVEVDDSASTGKILGAAFCVWSDDGTTSTTDDVLTNVTPLATAFALQAGATESSGGEGGGVPGSSVPSEPADITYEVATGGVNITMAPGQTTKTFSIVTSEELTASSFTGGNSAVATVNVGTSVKSGGGNASGGGSAEKLTSLTAGDEIIIGDGTNFLTLNGGTLGVTQNVNEATVWTVSAGNQGSGTYYLGSNGYYLSANWDGSVFSAKNTTYPAYNENWKLSSTSLVSYVGTRYFSLSSSGVSSSTTDSGVGAYDSNASFGGGETTPVQWTTSVTFAGVAAGNTTYTLSGTAAVDGGSDTTGYFFNITVVDSGVHVHHGGRATCISKAVCVDDGEEYGEVDPNNHVHTETRNAKEATFEEDGYTGDTWCTDCNTKITDGTTIPKLVAGAETITINEFAAYTFTVPSATKLEPNTTGMNTAVVSSVTTEFVEEVLGDPTTKLTSLTAGQEVYVSDGTNYLVLDGDTLTTTTDESKATKWTVSEKSDGKYDLIAGGKELYYSGSWGGALKVSELNTTGRWTFTNGNLISGEWPNTNIVLDDGTPRLKKESETPSAVAGAWLPATGSPAATKVTVTAGTQGTTSFLLGGTTYTVNVIPLDPTGKTLDIELFTSNTWCPLSGKQEDALNLTTLKVRENHTYILNATDAGVATAEGVTLDQIMPEFTWSSGNKEDPSHIARLLRGTYHPAGHWQYSMQFTDGQISADYYDQDCRDLTGKRYGASLDKTSMTELGAKEFWHIRYYATGWEVSSDGVTWTPLRDDDQVCARYLLETEVTQEVTTYVRDWANNSTTKDKWAKLDFAVKYASGDVSPSPDSYPISDKTLMYEADDSQTKLKTDENGKLMRWVDDIWGVETSDREVYMITLTRTDDNPDVKIGKTGKYTYEGQEKIVWLASAAENYNMDLPFHEDFMWGELPTEAQAANLNVTHPGLVSLVGAENLDTIGTTYGDPLVNRVYIYEEQGMLVTYYIRATEQGEKPHLKVNYYDEGDLSKPFYNYGIVVNTGTIFNSEFKMDESSETLLTGNTVVNDLGFTQTVSGVLKDMNAVPANYRTGDWTLTRVERSADGMTVNLYYSKDAAVNFVVDFGKVVNFNVNDFVKNADTHGGRFVFLRTHDGSFGHINELGTYDDATNTQTPVSYEEGVTSFKWYPWSVAYGRGHITYTIQFSDGSETSGAAYVYPATTMYYEDTAILPDDTYKLYFMHCSGTWTQQGGLPSGYQETAQTGAVQSSGKSQYGYDPFYATNNGPSGGTEMVTTEAGAYARYVFMGTGTEIYANCTPDTGVVMVALYNFDYANSKTGSLVRMMMVDTAMVNGASGVTGGQDVTAYNVPVASITGLDYGYYEVRMGLVNYKGTVRKDGFHIDGFRVFNTMGDTVNNIYAQDGEANPTFLELRDTVLAKVKIPESYDGQYADQIKKELGSSQVFANNKVTGLILSSAQDGVTEGNIENIVDLLDNGPKNEIYLRQGESFVFQYDSANYSAQVGLKGLNGLASATVNGEAKSIPTVDLYYKVTSPNGVVTIQNTGSNILSITNVKLLPVSQTVEASEASLLMLTADNVLDILGLSDPAPSDPAPTDPEPSDPEPSDPEPSDPEPTDPALTAKDFTDVKENAWYFSAVDFAATRGLMNGVGKNTFGPEAKLTRGMLVTILYRYEGCPEVDGSVSFQDVKADKYYSDAVAWAAENGIVNGMDEKTFAPDRNITREQMVAILYRYAKYKGVDVSGKNDLKAFPDAGKISEFAEDAFAWAVDAGVIQGSDGKLLPGGTATRAQVAQVLMNFIQKVVEA